MMKKYLYIIVLLVATLHLNAQVLTIPDSNFLAFLLNDTAINTNMDSVIQYSEVETVISLDVSSSSIQDLTGIIGFKSLTKLNCSNNQLTALDISGNVELDTLICDSNNLASVCVNSKQYQNISEYPINWMKDSTCTWSRFNCSVENDSCFALYYTTFDSTSSTFYGWVDSLSTEKAVRFRWDFGDNTFANFPSPAVYYNKDEKYTICMKIYIASGDSCEYCHTIGFDTLGGISKHGSLGNGFIFKVMQFGDTIVGVDQQISLPNNYTIQPNPSKGLMNVKFTAIGINTSVKVFSLMGQVIFEQKSNASNNFEIDISNEPAGVYLIEINQHGMITREKIIKL